MNQKTLIDSNLLVYSINNSSPKQIKAQNFLSDNKNLVISHQNILETARVLTHPKFQNPMTSKKALEAIFNIASVLTIISPNAQSIYLALEIIEKYNLKGDKVFDGYLAATALSNGIESIATDNEKDFKIFKGLKLINPF